MLSPTATHSPPVTHDTPSNKLPPLVREMRTPFHLMPFHSFMRGRSRMVAPAATQLVDVRHETEAIGARDLIADHCAPFQCSMRPCNPRVFPTAMHMVDDGHDTLERLSWSALTAPAPGASAAVNPDTERRTTVKPEIRRPLRTCLRDRWLPDGVHANDLRSTTPPPEEGTIYDGPCSERIIHTMSGAHLVGPPESLPGALFFRRAPDRSLEVELSSVWRSLCSRAASFSRCSASAQE